jgi:hypothetical protein
MTVGSIANKKAGNKNYGFLPVTQVVSGTGDPYWNNTSLLLLGNGANGGTNSSYIDSSTNNYTITQVGTAIQGSVGPVYGTTGSIYVNSGGVDIPMNAVGLQVGAGDFTAEAWVNPASTSNMVVIGGQGDYATNAGMSWSLYIGTSGTCQINVGATLYTVTAPVAPANTWSHVAFVRSGSNILTFLNGVQVGTTAVSGTVNNGTATYNAEIGTYKNGTNAVSQFIGYISNVRVIKGVALYTTTFTPPVGPLTAVANTSLLLNFNNAQVIDSRALQNIGIVGNAKLSTSSPKYGVASLYFDGTVGYAVMSTSSQLQFGTGDFTIEFWYNHSSRVSTYPSLFCNYNVAGAGGIGIFAGHSTNPTKYSVYFNNSTLLLSTSTLSSGWIHIAVVKFGGNAYLYINGIQEASSSVSGTLNGVGSNTYIGIAGDALNSTTVINGYIDDFRVTKGIARYTSNFQVPQTELPAYYSSLNYDPNWSNTNLLLHGDGSNAATNSTFLDSSTNNATITATGTPTQGSYSPFPLSTGNAYSKIINGGSMYFDGGSMVSLPGTYSPTSIGAGDFTFECWVKPDAVPGTLYWVYGARGGASDNTSPYLVITSTGYSFGTDGTNILVSSGAPSTSSWTHIAVVRIGSGTNNCKMYINGTMAVQATNTFNFTSTIGPSIGKANGATPYYFSGYISNVRLVVGTGIYTTNFTTPTAPLNAVTNTQLLLLGTNAAIYDNAAKSNLVVLGNSATMVSVNKFGGSSLFFDGTGDYLIPYNNSAFTLGAGDWTIECWIYLNSVGSQMTIYDGRPGSNGVYPYLYVAASGAVSYLTSSTVRLGSTTALSASTWYHIALCKVSGITTMYINGTNATGSSYTDVNTYLAPSAGYPRIGADMTAATGFNGYIDDFRITVGLARYTAAFVPPLTAFPDR